MEWITFGAQRGPGRTWLVELQRGRSVACRANLDLLDLFGCFSAKGTCLVDRAGYHPDRWRWSNFDSVIQISNPAFVCSLSLLLPFDWRSFARNLAVDLSDFAMKAHPWHPHVPVSLRCRLSSRATNIIRSHSKSLVAYDVKSTNPNCCNEQSSIFTSGWPLRNLFN